MADLIQLENLSAEALGEVIRARADEFDKSAMRAVEHAWHAGRALLAAKKLVAHGQWGQWLKDNFGDRSQQTASNWMQLASNYQRASNLEDATSVRHAMRLIAATPEKQAKKAEREAKKLEAPPEPSAPATIRHESPPTPQPQPPRPAWLADPDELERPEETDLPPLPKTNTHHTAENRREPDARETDRQGLVTIDDPRDYVDGAWYRFDESMGRLFWVTDDAVLERAKEIGQARGLWLVFSEPVINTESQTTDSRDTKKVAERERDTKRFVKPTPEQVSAYAAEIGALVDGQQFCDFYESKDWMIGKNKMKDWRAAVRTWSRSGKKPSPAQLRSQAAGTEDFGIEYEVVE